MSTRRYEQRLRAEQAEETRRRILDAVYEALRARPAGSLGLDDIARRARVARSTIYLVFGSRAGLFHAFAEDLWARSGFPRLTEAVANSDAREHLRGGIAAATRMFAAERDIYRVLHSMAQLDAESVGGAIETMENERRGGMEHLARRLDEDGLLRPDVTVEDATEVLWILCSFESFDLLHTGRGLPVDRSIELLVTTAERALLAPVPTQRRE
ncbi:MAG TPA: helix-turn-helix domain-containing protein [Acidimicrobiia bacterium]|nr:helix-turn-helix domain-containing protein [Acidimicrobiia bacterium]